MIIFDIKRYAINDGPGIRTTLFMKGCPLRCVWCHNPESWESQPELMFKQNKCIGCNSCGIHPHQLEYIRTKAQSKNLEVADLCPTIALEVCGCEYSLAELMAEVEKEREIMTESDGGVTLCGGEPLMHPQDALQILKELGRRGFHRTVDTSLYASPEVVQAIDAEADLFLIDLKHMDSDLHRRFTGVPNEPILRNIRLLAEKWEREGKSISDRCWFRIPLIEGVNADEQNIEATASFISNLSSLISHLSSVNSPPPTGGQGGLSLLPYHDVGKDKHRRRGTDFNPEGIKMTTPTEETLERCIQQFAAHGLTAKVGG